MFYQYTGQPGHGKTVLAIEFAVEMKQKADKQHEENPAKHPVRELYVCNVRDFNHGACGALDLQPDELKNWHTDSRFDNAIILVDEAYEHEMFPRRPPGRPVPEHVKQVAKHRHRGIDFIMICQSPKKQMDDFLHDLIEEHYHIRRRYGLPFAHVKRWDRFEPSPDKAESLTTTRRKYPKHIFKLYTSTKYDTSEKRVPWFYWATGGMLIFVVGYGYYAVGGTFATLRGEKPDSGAHPSAVTGANGAPATVAPGAAAVSASSQKVKWSSTEEYITAHVPRVPAMPWSAPVYDDASITAQPELYCMASSAGQGGQGEHLDDSCICLTEQGTPYRIGPGECRFIARHGTPYNPYRVVRDDRGGSQGVAAGASGVAPASSEGKPAGDVNIAVGAPANGSFANQEQLRYGG